MTKTKTINLNEIKIKDDFRSPMPTASKFKNKYQQFKCTGKLPSTIVVDENYTLLDGYISYLLAKAFDYKEVEVVLWI